MTDDKSSQPKEKRPLLRLRDRLLALLERKARRLSTRMQGLSYLHRGIVLTIDSICSLLATLTSTILLVFIFPGALNLHEALMLTLIITLLSVAVFLIFRFYKFIIRHSNLRSLPRIMLAQAATAAIVCAAGILVPAYDPRHALLCSLFYFLFSSFYIVGVRMLMICAYYFLVRVSTNSKEYRRSGKVLIYGDTQQTASVAAYLNNAYKGEFTPAGFVDPANSYHNMLVSELPVYGKTDMEELEGDIRDRSYSALIFISHQDLLHEKGRMVEWCTESGLSIFVIRKLAALNPDAPGAPVDIAPVRIEDLLERPEIRIEEDRIAAALAGKVVMVTGAAGSIGSELARQLCRFAPARLILLDNAETPLHLIRLEIEENHPGIPLTALMADVRNAGRCRSIIAEWKPTVIFHAAAYKHVPLVEENPAEGIITNVHGSINIAELAQECGVARFVMISTDKAVNPTNVMGATKRAAEMYVQSKDAAMRAEGRHGTSYITTRFGNVLGSNGSVVPRFHKQIAHGGPVTVTHPDIIRYFMTIPEACRLVLQAAVMGEGGEIYVFDMGEPVRIAELAERMIRLSGMEPGKDIGIQYTGLRPGEKLYEEVLSDKECTTETSHHKIRIAKAVDNTFEDIKAQTDALIAAARSGDAPAAVQRLKALVREFKSNNSRWAMLDK